MNGTQARIYSGRIDPRERNSAWTKIIELVGYSRRVLEVGCATGYMSEFLTQQRRCQVTGIEINPIAASEAAKYCEVLVDDVENNALDRVAGCFDVIIFADVLEHLRDPLTVLRTAGNHLTENGFILISLPNIAHWEVRRALFFGRFEYTKSGLLDDTHLRFFTYDSAVRFVQDAGFKIEFCDVVFRGPRHWKYETFYRRWERQVHWIISRWCRGLFGYQFIFRLRPTTAMLPRVGSS